MIIHTYIHHLSTKGSHSSQDYYLTQQFTLLHECEGSQWGKPPNDRKNRENGRGRYGQGRLHHRKRERLKRYRKGKRHKLTVGGVSYSQSLIVPAMVKYGVPTAAAEVAA